MGCIHRNPTETLPKPDRNSTETQPKPDRSSTETQPELFISNKNCKIAKRKEQQDLWVVGLGTSEHLSEGPNVRDKLLQCSRHSIINL